MQAAAATTTDGAGPPTARRRGSNAKLGSLPKLQGQYMGLVRNLRPKQKALLRVIREKHGYGAAIRRARRLVGAQ